MDIYNMTTKIGFSAEYIERICPAERDMYLKYYLKEKKEEQQRKKNKPSGPSIGSPMGA